MPRLRFRDEWFDEVDATRFYESEFEAVILQNPDLLCPGAFLVPFKERIQDSSLNVHCADLALIDRDYRFWWVIEVELTSHSLYSHVLPQVSTFLDGYYGTQHARALLKTQHELEEIRLHDMLRGEQPRVVVIADRFLDDWRSELRHVGAYYAVLNVFRSPENADIIYFDGILPAIAAQHISRAVPVNGIPRMLRLLSPGGIPGSDRSRLKVFFEGRPTTWMRVETNKQCFITPHEPLNLAKRRSYVLETDGDRLILREEGS
jgi:hypothetical protein